MLYWPPRALSRSVSLSPLPQIDLTEKGRNQATQAGKLLALHGFEFDEAHASVLIAELAPSAPYAAPASVRFLGKESIVAPLRARFSPSVQRAWDPSGRTSLRE